MNRRSIIFLFIGFGLFVAGGDVEAYDDKTTHPALTSEIVDFYNSLHPERLITSEQKDWVILGSKEEDVPPRWLNHFYDPVHQTAWTGLKADSVSPDAIYNLAVAGNAGYAPVSAVDWLNNNSLQQNLSLYGGNHTWQAGLDDYAVGNTREAYITLGHTLHLLEDMAVPEHTRDDAHAPIASAGNEGSPLENYLTKWNENNIKELNIVSDIKAEGLSPPAKNSIADYLKALAEYSNKYFFSKDTINDQKYEFPKILSEDTNFGYGIDENGQEIPLAKVWIYKTDEPKIVKTFIIGPNDEYILNTYFDHLSKQAVLYGAGVIELFNRQTNDALENKEFSTHIVKYDFSFLPIKAVSIIGEGSKILAVTQSFFGSVFDGAKKVANIVVSPFQNIIFQPPVVRNQQSTGDIQTVQPPSPQISLNPSAVGQIQGEEKLVEIETVQSIEPPLRKKISQEKSTQGEISQEELLAIKNQLDDISDQLDDLSSQFLVQNKMENLNEVKDLATVSNNSSVQNQSATTINQQVFGGGGGVSYTTPENKIYPKILITEIQLASASSTHEEFVELYNPNENTVDLTDWYLQKKTSNGSSFTTFASKNLLTSKIIPARSYLLIAHPSSTFTADVFTDYGISDNNTLVLKNPDGAIVDKVGWGDIGDCEGDCALNPADNQSIQRKFSNGEFLDTDNNANDFELLTCPSPGVQSRNCEVATPITSPIALFSFTPASAETNQTVLFDASSSIDPSGGKLTYEWNFGDAATSTLTQATTTHTYSMAGNYTITLTVFNSQNASSTAMTPLTVVAASSGLAHILISEIQAVGADAGDEFIELYNPNSTNVDISGYSIQYISGGATSTENALKKNFETNNSIPAKGFFLVGRGLNSSSTDGYRGSTAADMTERTFSLSAQGATILLVENQSLVSSFFDSDVADSVTYPALGVNTSFERKALLDSNCISAQSQNEFLGNGCDTDSTADFEIRPVSNPQNSRSLPEPRNAPSVSNFKGNFSTSTMELTLTWGYSQDIRGVTSTIVYKLIDETATSIQLFYGSSTDQFIKMIDTSSTGRDYIFSLQAYDAEGLGGASSTITIPVPLVSVSVSTSTATSTNAEPQVLLEDTNITWRASTDMCCQMPFLGYKALTPATTTYNLENFFITKIHIAYNTDNSGNNHNGFGHLQAALLDQSSGSVIISSSNSCYGENGCNNFDLIFENSPLIPATFWLQFYVNDGLQGAADWGVDGITIYGIPEQPL